ncbi:MAG TPA: class II fructose-bisphosphate aldolase [Chloroflexi bacterium]|jgi:fructose-bisphosphate aldolase class II|nr:class II fructose-bisphosphate aldolase [Chloroflexota bacterium]
MPLVSIRDELARAQAGHYGIPCFDVFDMVATEGTFLAIEDQRAPTIIAIYAGFIDRPGADVFANAIRTMASQATVPVSLILDHGASYEQCIKALTYGFTDVMFDGSQLPVEENIAITSMVVRAAHAVGASVEAELGHVGRGSDYEAFGGQRQGFTDPALAERFVAETGVDSLAVAIGTAHGVYKGTPCLDLDLLAEIRRRVDVPLVMHGGSGLSEEQFKAAIEAGITKINVATDLMLTAGAKMIETAKADDASYFGILDAARQSYRQRTAYYMDLFGATGKA